MTRIFNFCSGPATMPLPVLEKARDEFLDFQGTGMSIMEVSHRSAIFDEVVERAESSLRRLMSIPDNYAVLFLAGGATTQFSQLPINMATPERPGAYVVNGAWGKKAYTISNRLGLAHMAASSEAEGFRSVPDRSDWDLDGPYSYLHYVSNETISGVQFPQSPEAGLPLVADMSSDILSRPVAVDQYAAIYAGAQKNIGQAGISIVIVDKSLLKPLDSRIPDLQSWKIQFEQSSRLNTPPTFAWYMAGLVFNWVEEQGGVIAMEAHNRAKSERFYQFLDSSGFYVNDIPAGFRSHMNIPFKLMDESLHGQFVSEAEAAGLSGLKGHRSVGGMRASMYNAMPMVGVEALIEFMTTFERRTG